MTEPARREPSIDDPWTQILLVPTDFRLVARPEAGVDDVAAHMAEILFGGGSELLAVDHPFYDVAVEATIHRIALLIGGKRADRDGLLLRYVFNGRQHELALRVFMLREGARKFGGFIDYKNLEPHGIERKEAGCAEG